MLVFTPAIHFAAFFERFTCFLNPYRGDSRHNPPQPPFMNNNSRPENHLRSLSATFAAFHISTRTALIILSLYCLRVFTECNTFCLGKCSCSTVCLGQKKDRGWKPATTECSSLLKRSLSLPDAVVALCVYIKTNRCRMQNASKEMFCVQYRGPHRGRCDGTFCSRCWMLFFLKLSEAEFYAELLYFEHFLENLSVALINT